MHAMSIIRQDRRQLRAVDNLHPATGLEVSWVDNEIHALTASGRRCKQTFPLLFIGNATQRLGQRFSSLLL